MRGTDAAEMQSSQRESRMIGAFATCVDNRPRIRNTAGEHLVRDAPPLCPSRVLYFATGPEAQVILACIGVKMLYVIAPTNPFRKLRSVMIEATP
jgi:hypothetical protein